MEELAAILQQNNVDTSTLNLLSNFNDETIYYLTVPGGQVAIDLWYKLRTLVEQTGFRPVIMGREENLKLVLDGLESTPEAATQIIEEAVQLDAIDWFELHEDDELDQTEVHGDWPDEEMADNFFSLPHDILTREPLEKVVLAFIPTKDSWEIPAYLKTGNWNECPTPAEHSAILNYWQASYGAEVVGISGDTIEMLVAYPPKSKEEALKLAEEQFIYDADIVTQGMTTIENLAASLLNANVWYFWWD